MLPAPHSCTAFPVININSNKILSFEAPPSKCFHLPFKYQDTGYLFKAPSSMSSALESLTELLHVKSVVF